MEPWQEESRKKACGPYPGGLILSQNVGEFFYGRLPFKFPGRATHGTIFEMGLQGSIRVERQRRHQVLVGLA